MEFQNEKEVVVSRLQTETKNFDLVILVSSEEEATRFTHEINKYVDLHMKNEVVYRKAHKIYLRARRHIFVLCPRILNVETNGFCSIERSLKSKSYRVVYGRINALLLTSFSSRYAATNFKSENIMLVVSDALSRKINNQMMLLYASHSTSTTSAE